jgi:ankyrin repeat protein
MQDPVYEAAFFADPAAEPPDEIIAAGGMDIFQTIIKKDYAALEGGADVKAVNNDGKSALDIATEKNNEPLVKYLLSKTE